MLLALAVAAALTTHDVPATLGDRVAEAREASGIAVLLPGTIDSEFDKLFGNLLPSTEGRYGLVLGAARGCNGASVCGVANFYGVKGGERRGGRPVKLRGGRKGYFKASRCGANCSFPSIQFTRRGVLYTIEYKETAKRGVMKRLANRALRAGPRS